MADKSEQATPEHRGPGRPPRKRPGEDLVLPELRAVDPAAVSNLRATRADSNEITMAYVQSGLAVLNAFSRATKLPMGIRIEAAMKLADVGIAMLRKNVGLPTSGVQPAAPDAGDDDLGELPDDLEGGSGGASPAPPGAPEVDEPLPPGWGEDPPEDGVPALPPGEPLPPAQPAAAPAAPVKDPPKRPGAPKKTTAQKILRKVRAQGPVTKTQLRDATRLDGFKNAPDLQRSIDFLLQKGLIVEIQRNNRVFYCAPDQVPKGDLP